MCNKNTYITITITNKYLLVSRNIIIEAISLYQSGESITKIAERLKYSPTAVRKFLLAHHVPLRKRWDWCTKSFPLEEIKAAYLVDVPIKEIAARYEVHPKTIVRCLKDAKVYKLDRRLHNRKNVPMSAIRTLLVQGKTYREISKDLNISETTLLRRIKQFRLKKSRPVTRTGKKGRPTLIIASAEEMKDLYNQGWSINRLSKRYGYSDDTIKMRLSQLGVTIRRWGVQSKSQLPHYDEIKDLYSQGWSLYMLGKRFKLSEETISARFKADGIQIRGRHDPLHQGKRGKPMIEIPLEQLRQDRATGFTFPQLALKYQVSVGTIRNRMRH